MSTMAARKDNSIPSFDSGDDLGSRLKSHLATAGAWLLLGPLAFYDTLFGLGVTRSVRAIVRRPAQAITRAEDPHDARVALWVAAVLWWLPILVIQLVPAVTWGLYVAVVFGMPLTLLATFLLVDGFRYGWRNEAAD